ncbi:MAG: gfo/Idh/MocA family oxidoreductase [Planctomycetota bacterium]|nr:MAG: gfo/Idh/MocA family oxidoreductase [Planctomycetota bacterium]
MSPTSRRSFLAASSALAGGALLRGAGASTPAATAAAPAPPRNPMGDDEIRVALIGCGGRGTGAAGQALSTAGEVRLVAMADAFSDRLEGSLRSLTENFGDKVAVPPERRFVGFDAYRKAIDSDVDLVILTTPPGFRPIHFDYAVEKGRHVFMEKPVAVDAPGVRKVLKAAEEAKRKNLKVGVGLQRHHDPRYQETVRRLQEGAVGRFKLFRAYWNGAGVWVNPRQPGQTEMEYQMRNWYYFVWLCGDHIVEQHIHNLDVCNWVMGGPPVEAQGMGGRQVRTGKDYGEIYDHHMVEFTYADGTKLLSQCRHIPGCANNVSEHVHGADGYANISAGVIEGPGGWKWRWRGEGVNPYQVEHDDLFAAIRQDTPYNEAEYGALSTMTAIFGRMATYSGQVVTWEEAFNSDLALLPAAYDWNADPPTLPDAEGNYPIPMPGSTRAF